MHFHVIASAKESYMEYYGPVCFVQVTHLLSCYSEKRGHFLWQLDFGVMCSPLLRKNEITVHCECGGPLYLISVAAPFCIGLCQQTVESS